MTRRGILTVCFLAVFGGTLLLVGGYTCPFLRATGIPCPGCGMTHALQCIVHLDLKGAWHYNAISFLLPVILLLVLFDGKLFRKKKYNKILLIALCFLTVVFYMKNLIYYI